MSKSSRRPSGTTSQRTASTGPSGTPRAGRRTRVRPYESPSFLQRNRSRLLWAAGIAAAALVGAFVFLSAGAPSYACTAMFDPSPSPTPSGSPTRAGYVQPDMGNSHTLSSPQRYAFCPPASGPHSDRFGPMRPAVYEPDSGALPQGWIHNLEHNGLVVLYNGRLAPESLESEKQQEFRRFFADFPPSPICGTPPGTDGPVIARFDEMAYPYAALLWGRVLPLDSFDTEAILEFYRLEGDRATLEPRCDPNAAPSGAPSGSPAPSDAASPSAAPSADTGASPSGSPAPSASPS